MGHLSELSTEGPSSQPRWTSESHRSTVNVYSSGDDSPCEVWASITPHSPMGSLSPPHCLADKGSANRLPQNLPLYDCDTTMDDSGSDEVFQPPSVNDNLYEPMNPYSLFNLPTPENLKRYKDRKNRKKKFDIFNLHNNGDSHNSSSSGSSRPVNLSELGSISEGDSDVDVMSVPSSENAHRQLPPNEECRISKVTHKTAFGPVKSNGVTVSPSGVVVPSPVISPAIVSPGGDCARAIADQRKRKWGPAKRGVVMGQVSRETATQCPEREPPFSQVAPDDDPTGYHRYKSEDRSSMMRTTSPIVPDVHLSASDDSDVEVVKIEQR